MLIGHDLNMIVILVVVVAAVVSCRAGGRHLTGVPGIGRGRVAFFFDERPLVVHVIWVVVNHLLLLRLLIVLRRGGGARQLILLTRRPVARVEERLGERVVFDFEGGNFLVLVGGHSNELRQGKRESPDDAVSATISATLVHFDDMQPRLVLVEAVEHDFVLGVALVGQLDLCEADGLFGPVAPVIRGIWVFIDGVIWRGFRFAS